MLTSLMRSTRFSRGDKHVNAIINTFEGICANRHGMIS